MYYLKKTGCLLLAILLLFNGCGTIQGKQALDEPAQTYEAEVNTTEITERKIDVKNGYKDSRRQLSFYGLKEYNCFQFKKNTEKPKKGNKYLVLFLKIDNYDNKTFYIHENYFSSKLDGDNYDHTVIFSEPEAEYVTCFSNVPSGYSLYGFIVWEVPEKWSTLDVEYKGLKDAEGLLLKMELTKKDLSEPHDISRSEIHDGLGQIQ